MRAMHCAMLLRCSKTIAAPNNYNNNHEAKTPGTCETHCAIPSHGPWKPNLRFSRKSNKRTHTRDAIHITPRHNRTPNRQSNSLTPLQTCPDKQWQAHGGNRINKSHAQVSNRLTAKTHKRSKHHLANKNAQLDKPLSKPRKLY